MGDGHYSFETVWLINAQIETVWEAIVDSERWPEWWPHLESVVEIAGGDFYGIGSVRRYAWGGSLPYRLVFQVLVTNIERPFVIEGVLSGDLEGYGNWTLSEQGASSTRVLYCLRARSTKPWMNIAAPILRWFFTWNHNRVMNSGGEGLEIYLHSLERAALQPGK